MVKNPPVNAGGMGLITGLVALINRVSEELWTEVHDIVQEAVINHPQEKEMQIGKMAV